MSFSVYAYDNVDLLGVTKEEFDGWTDEQINTWFHTNFDRYISSGLGFLGSAYATEQIEAEFALQVDKSLVGEETYEQWVARNLGMEEDENGAPQLCISDELSDALYLACMKYINEYTGWMNLYSYDVKQIASTFENQSIYNALMYYVKNKANDELVFARVSNTNNVKFLDIFIIKYDGLIIFPNTFNATYNAYKVYAEDTWTELDYNFSADGSWNDGDGQWISLTYYESASHRQWKTEVSCAGQPFYMHTGIPLNPSFSENTGEYFLFDNGMRQYRAYKSMEDYKSYSVGTRPYFITDKFKNYNASGDNSCILTESQLNGSSVYGDVVNYITNNYGDAANGLTEEQIIAIVTAIIDAMQDDSSGSGSSGGSGDSSGPSWGWSSLLDGLGGLLDGVLAIIGKLFEYIGKALDLFTGTLEKILDVIPKNVSNLLVGLFPFIPEEWTVAIELSLVLSIILMIIGFVKK